MVSCIALHKRRWLIDRIDVVGADGGVHGLRARRDRGGAVGHIGGGGGGGPRAAVADGGTHAAGAGGAFVVVVLPAVHLHREPRVLDAHPLDGRRRRAVLARTVSASAAAAPGGGAAARLAPAGVRPAAVPGVRGRGRGHSGGNARDHLLRAAAAAGIPQRATGAVPSVARPPPVVAAASGRGVQGVQRRALPEGAAAAGRAGAEDGQDGHRAHAERARGNARTGARRRAPAGGRRRRAAAPGAAAAAHQQPAAPHDLGAAPPRAAQRELPDSQSTAPSRIKGTTNPTKDHQHF
jgi:hypothetical protein